MLKAVLTVGLISISVSIGSADEPTLNPPSTEQEQEQGATQSRRLNLRPPIQAIAVPADSGQVATPAQKQRRDALRKLEEAEAREAIRLRELDREVSEHARVKAERQERLLAEIRAQFGRLQDRPREVVERDLEVRERAIQETRERLLDLRRELAKQLENRADGERIADVQQALRRTERQLAEMTREAGHVTAFDRDGTGTGGASDHDHGDHDHGDHDHGDHDHGDHDHGDHDHGDHDHGDHDHGDHDHARELHDAHDRDHHEHSERELHEMRERELHHRQMQQRERDEREREERAHVERLRHMEQLEHAHLAIEHLSEAGFDELAREARRRAEELQRQHGARPESEPDMMRMIHESHRAIEGVHERMHGLERRLKSLQDQVERMKRGQSRSHPSNAG